MELCKDVLLKIVSKCDWKTRIAFNIKPKKLVIDYSLVSKLTRVLRIQKIYSIEYINNLREFVFMENNLIANIYNINTEDFIELMLKYNLYPIIDKLSFYDQKIISIYIGYTKQLVNFVFTEYDRIDKIYLDQDINPYYKIQLEHLGEILLRFMG